VRNWNQFGIAYDAVVLKHVGDYWSFDLGLSWNTMMNLNTGKPSFDNTQYYAENLIKSLNFLRISRSLTDHINISAWVIGTGYVNPSYPEALFMTGTYGLFSELSYDWFNLPLEIYYQNGKAQTAKPVEAFAFGLKPSVNISDISIGMGFDYLSGDDAGKMDYGVKEKTFNKFYGSVFRYHGWMNYYSYIKGSTGNGGLMDLFPFITWKISSRHTLEGKVHIFNLANKILLADKIVSDLYLGTEFDTRYTWKIKPDLSFNAGFSYYQTSPTFIDVMAGSDPNIRQPVWLWVMISFTPDLFLNQ
jgi:hypothetical protein